MPQTLYPWRPSISLPEGSTPLLVIGIVSSDLTTLPHELANRIADLPAFTAPPPAKYARSQSARQEAELRMHKTMSTALFTSSSWHRLRSRWRLRQLSRPPKRAAIMGGSPTPEQRALIVLFHLCQVFS